MSTADQDRALVVKRVAGLDTGWDKAHCLAWVDVFSAIAGDAAGFKRSPATGSYYNHPDVGLPTGKLYDLEELVETLGRISVVFLLFQCPTQGSCHIISQYF